MKANGTVAIFSVRKWASEKHKSWSVSAEDFKGHVATDGSLLGNGGKWRACGWAVVQLDYDEEMGASAWDVRLDGRGSPHHQEGGVDSFLVLPQESMWTLKGSMWTTRVQLMEPEMQARRSKFGEKEHELVNRGILVEVAHVKAHRTKKEKEKMTQSERFVTEGNEE